jgi:hypothetical protein
MYQIRFPPTSPNPFPMGAAPCLCHCWPVSTCRRHATGSPPLSSPGHRPVALCTGASALRPPPATGPSFPPRFSDTVTSFGSGVAQPPPNVLVARSVGCDPHAGLLWSVRRSRPPLPVRRSRAHGARLPLQSAPRSTRPTPWPSLCVRPRP